jgi:hypothetical protein
VVNPRFALTYGEKTERSRTGKYLRPSGGAAGAFRQVKFLWVKFRTCTLLRDEGKIATSDYINILFSGPGYVDVLGDTFYVNKAMRADGVPVTL